MRYMNGEWKKIFLLHNMEKHYIIKTIHCWEIQPFHLYAEEGAHGQKVMEVLLIYQEYLLLLTEAEGQVLINLSDQR